MGCMQNRQKDCFRHGDVTLKRVAKPLTPVGKKQDHCILAYGEVTGHKHEVFGDATLFKEENGKMYLVTGKEPAVLDHPEHGKITLEPETGYEVGIQREYEPEGWRQVAD